jgi:uncharacterized protein (DUF2141 family)
MVWLGGERRLAGSGGAVTDDEGAYRIFGLPAGEYAIRATPGPGGSIRKLSVAEIDAALDPRRAISPDESPDVTYGRSAIFFPGTPRQDEARLVQVRLGEETGGVNFAVRMVPTVRLAGDLSGGGVEMTAEPVSVTVFGEAFGLRGRSTLARGPVGQSKAFALTGVPPGHYTILVRTPGTAGDGTMWAAATVDVAGLSVDGIRLLLQPTFAISGVVGFENATTTPPTGDFQVAALSDGAPEWGTDGASPIDPGGRFTITGVVPGRYRLRVQARTAAISVATTWFIKSAMVDGIDAVDLAVDVQSGRAIEGVVATMSEQRTEVTGMLQTPEGQAAPDVHIVVFSADRRYWTGYSRRIQAVRPGSDGRYRIVGLPAGDYYMAALTDVEPGEWFSPDFLDALMPAAVTLRLEPAEKKTRDIKIVGKHPRPSH